MRVDIDEYAVVDYRHYNGVVYVNEDGHQVTYSVSLTTDKSHAMISKSICDNGEKVNIYCKEVTKDFLVANSAEYNPLVVWLVRGMWGIPI